MSARENAKALRRAGIEVEEHDVISASAEKHGVGFGPVYVLIDDHEKEYWRFPGHVGLDRLKEIHSDFTALSRIK